MTFFLDNTSTNLCLRIHAEADPGGDEAHRRFDGEEERREVTFASICFLYLNCEILIRGVCGDRCYSMVGREGGKQYLSLGSGCEYHGTVVHEIGHALGFFHEQMRSDRDDYLTIFWDNIMAGLAYAFAKQDPDKNLLLTEFDYKSIMIYGEMAFSKDGLSKTMVDKFGKVKLTDPFQKYGLSLRDLKRIQKLYKCEE
ncbi:hypothetical protein LAZ67_14002671 [Cordylochernes scorpioides]|uniref:Metalloendopeptidase n=1 Tax=Cordylochernes scorpioides TaxID=51811 RepID=A0ABY6LAN2_9ARAC|nr:hypothetical protein LAZ67_14002671 [Cordylochernes scorpioides]